MFKIAVTGAGALLGQGMLRSLQASQLPISLLALDPSPLSAGLYWGGTAYRLPFASAPDYLPAIERLLQRERPHALLVGTDVELVVLAQAREHLEAKYQVQVLVSSPEVVAIADDKYRTAGFMAAQGFDAPASALGSDAAAVRELVASLGFPLIVKPCVGARSVGVHKVTNEQELAEALARVAGSVVQECIGGDSQEYTASGLYFDGRCDAVIVMRRDLRDGNTYRAFVDQDPMLREQVRRWTVALKPHGPANFQFRIDAQGRPKVFEINGRFSGTTPLRALAGFNEVEICLRRLLLSEPVTQPPIKPIIVLRHWHETLIDDARLHAVQPV